MQLSASSQPSPLLLRTPDSIVLSRALSHTIAAALAASAITFAAVCLQQSCSPALARMADPWSPIDGSFKDRFPDLSELELNLKARKIYVMCENVCCPFFDDQGSRLNYRAKTNDRLETVDAVERYADGIAVTGLVEGHRN
eukprot:7945431-Alexandrium_andersonii.AAC.1